MSIKKPEVVGYIAKRDLEYDKYRLGPICMAADSWPGSVALIRLSDYEALQAECHTLKSELAESRANDRQAMAYLEAVRGIVGGDSFPEMIGRVKELQIERNGYKLALKEWLEKSEQLGGGER